MHRDKHTKFEVFNIVYSTRVSNELGAGRPQAAKIALAAVIVLSATEVVLASTTLFAVRNVWGYAFSNEKEVVTYVAEITPILCISIIMDGTQAVLSGYLFYHPHLLYFQIANYTDTKRVIPAFFKILKYNK